MTLVKFNNRHTPKVFNSFFDEFLNGYPSAFTKESFSHPQVNITETPEAYLLELNVPGRSKEDFKLNIENNLLTISFEKKEEVKNENAKTIRREFSYSSFKRSFNLDEKIDAENIQAKYENGILQIDLPKKPEVKQSAKQITIQ